MMVTANCIRKTAGGCLRRKGKRAASENMVRLLDRYRTEFPVETDCGYCYNIIYNSVPISLHAYLGRNCGKESGRGPDGFPGGGCGGCPGKDCCIPQASEPEEGE